MKNAQKTQFNNIEKNAYEFHRLRASQERQKAMKDFFSGIFGINR